jgi:hypothetical protein
LRAKSKAVMTAVDTNLVIRLLTQDDRKQAAIASTVFATGEVWIAKSVLLETAWVLESIYGLDAIAKYAGPFCFSWACPMSEWRTRKHRHSGTGKHAWALGPLRRPIVVISIEPDSVLELHLGCVA